MSTNRCYIKLSNPNTTATDHESSTAQLRTILGSAYGPDFLFEYDTWTRQMFIDYGISEVIVPDSGWDDTTKSIDIILETQQDISGFVDVFFTNEFSVKVKTAWEDNGWTLSEPEIKVE
jgi:hypothetical protein